MCVPVARREERTILEAMDDEGEVLAVGTHSEHPLSWRLHLWELCFRSLTMLALTRGPLQLHVTPWLVQVKLREIRHTYN